MKEIQHNLFNMGGMYAYLEIDGVAVSRVEDLEVSIVTSNAELEPLKDCILPGGNRDVA